MHIYVINEKSGNCFVNVFIKLNAFFQLCMKKYINIDTQKNPKINAHFEITVSFVNS